MENMGFDNGTGWTNAWCFRSQPFRIGAYHLVDGEWKETKGDKS